MLSDLIKKFEKMDAEQEFNGKRVLTPEQAFIFKDIFKKYKTGERFAVCDARSGSGKTTLIRAIERYCIQEDINIAITASTGKASSALGGQTIHSFMGLKMTPNENAEKKDEALKLSSELKEDMSKPDILVIDEASMIGKNLFKEIDKARFPFVFFVMDGQQLPPVKEKKVDWENITPLQYTLTKTLRAKEPRMAKLFDDFKDYKEGKVEDFDLNSYVNGENIVKIDWSEVDYIPTNSECCAVAYRNKLVEFLVNKLKQPQHNMYNLNGGIIETRMVADVMLDSGYYKRNFKEEQIFFNGEDVKIDKLLKETDQIVDKGYCFYKGYKISINKSKTGLMVSAHSDCVAIPPAKEPIEYKVFLKFPIDEVIERCTLACINDKHFVFLWDDSEDELNEILDESFSKLLPRLKVIQSCKKWYKTGDEVHLIGLPFDVKAKLRSVNQKEFMDWFSGHPESVERKKRWSEFLGIKKVVSARATVARTIFKAQGLSIPAVVVFDESFYGASVSAQYVALTRGKQGLILVENTPDNWKN